MNKIRIDLANLAQRFIMCKIVVCKLIIPDWSCSCCCCFLFVVEFPLNWYLSIDMMDFLHQGLILVDGWLMMAADDGFES